MYIEIKEVILGAEKVYDTFINDPDVPELFIAAPYILALEREMIQFFKHKFPKFLVKQDPGKELSQWDSKYEEMKEMILGSERISLGHVINWMGRIPKESEDELFLMFVSFIRVMDPEAVFFNKSMVQLLSNEIQKYRKYCVHISSKDKWFDSGVMNRIREIVLFECDGLGKGILPGFIELEGNVVEFLG